MSPAAAGPEEHTIALPLPAGLQHMPLPPPAGVLSTAEAAATMGPFTTEYAPPWAHHSVRPRKMSLGCAFVTRVLDIVISLVILTMTAPILLALALWIRSDSPGPALFKQQRLGKRLKSFTFYKFRTMYTDAKERFPELYAYAYSPQEIQTMHFKLLDDPRLTRVGRWLRKTSLDEFPNFINVLKGDMTLVGPRPELPEFFAYYQPWQQIKWRVKPGVTGYAQVQGRGYLTLQETIYWDVKFCLERSLGAYLSTLGRTAWAVGKGIGAF